MILKINMIVNGFINCFCDRSYWMIKKIYDCKCLHTVFISDRSYWMTLKKPKYMTVNGFIKCFLGTEVIG